MFIFAFTVEGAVIYVEGAVFILQERNFIVAIRTPP